MANSEPTTSSEAPQLVALIVAVGANRAIGLDNQLLWRLPEDMAYFKATTQGRPVIMQGPSSSGASKGMHRTVERVSS